MFNFNRSTDIWNIVQWEISSIKLHKPLWTHWNSVGSRDAWSPKTGRGRKDPWLEPLKGLQHWENLTSDMWSPGLRGHASVKAGGEGDDRGWDGCMVSPTQWTWVWVSSRRWWRTGEPIVLQSVKLQGQPCPSDWAAKAASPLQLRPFSIPWKEFLVEIRSEVLRAQGGNN